MKHLKKLVAAICAVTITLSVAGCADVSTIGSIDDQTINAGIYLLYEQSAISEAQEEVDDQLKAMGTDSSSNKPSSGLITRYPSSIFFSSRTSGIAGNISSLPSGVLSS